MGRGSRKNWGRGKKCVSGCSYLKRCPQTIRYSSLQNVEPFPSPWVWAVLSDSWFTDCGGTDGCNFCVWGLKDTVAFPWFSLCLVHSLSVCSCWGKPPAVSWGTQAALGGAQGNKEPLFWPTASEELRLLPITAGMSLEAGPSAPAEPSSACGPCQYFVCNFRRDLESEPPSSGNFQIPDPQNWDHKCLLC